MTRAPVFFVFSTCYSDSLEVLVLRAGKERENSKGNCKENSETQKENGLVRTIMLEAVEACGGVVVSGVSRRRNISCRFMPQKLGKLRPHGPWLVCSISLIWLVQLL